jgi:sulfate transport system ATP-binding protein
VLFRPEDVMLAPTEEALDGPALGQGEVEHSTFAGSLERLRLRLPPLSGVRPIAPIVPFGGDFLLVEVTRSPDQAQRFPLQPGDSAWVGVRRIHALVHPGLSFLIVTDGQPAGQTALAVGGQIARLAHARTTILGYSPRPADLDGHLREAREQIGSGLPALETRTTFGSPAEAVQRETELQPYDLVVLGSSPQRGIELAGHILEMGEHHLLLIPRPQQTFAHVLICVAAGEPGKDDVLFAGRLVRHLGADATLLTVLPKNMDQPRARERMERFLAAGVRTLGLLGVQARPLVRIGAVRDEIMAEMAAGGYDLLVLGAPLHNRDGRGSLAGVVGELLTTATDRPVLIVRSPYAAGRAPWLGQNGRVAVIEEVIR